MRNQAALYAYKRALDTVGQHVTVQRWTGQAPTRVLASSVTVKAVVRTVTADNASVARTGASESKPGAITQTERHVILLAHDLDEQGFPLPVKKNDKVVVQGETMNVTEVDPNTRLFADAIDLTIAGV